MIADTNVTVHFQTCFGVFQGGGCRAAAYVGAVQEAESRGVHFSALAGTSAGAIVAALLGAGATAAQLHKYISELNFLGLLEKPEGTGWRPFAGTIGGVFKCSPIFSHQILGYTLSHQGRYSSERLEDWIESKLEELLPKVQRPVRFSDLPIPTGVVAGDLLTRRAKVWSSDLTPDDGVKKAVRASCSIPFFFQPLERRYVDGGILSNLPTFVHRLYPPQVKPMSSRILAFTLVADEVTTEHWNAGTLMTLLTGTIVDGAQDIQSRLSGDVYSIPISTGAVQATDFNKMDSKTVNILIESGKKAACDFFDREAEIVREDGATSSRLLGEHEAYLAAVENLSRRTDDLIICEQNTEFVYELFPALLAWRLRGVPIHVVVPQKETREDHGAYRRKVLRGLGIVVHEVESVPATAYLFNRSDPESANALVAGRDARKDRPNFVRYVGFADLVAIQAITEKVLRLFPSELPLAGGVPTIVRGSNDTVINAMKHVRQYSPFGVDVTIGDVPTVQLKSLARYVLGFKYLQLRELINEYSKHDIRLFDPAAVQFAGSQISPITPPVVEQVEDSYLLIEGTTRAVFCRDQGVNKIRCVIVRHVRDPLPAEPFPFRDVQIAGRTVTTAERYRNWNRPLFREIEKNMRPLDSL